MTKKKEEDRLRQALKELDDMSGADKNEEHEHDFAITPMEDSADSNNGPLNININFD